MTQPPSSASISLPDSTTAQSTTAIVPGGITTASPTTKTSVIIGCVFGGIGAIFFVVLLFACCYKKYRARGRGRGSKRCDVRSAFEKSVGPSLDTTNSTEDKHAVRSQHMLPYTTKDDQFPNSDNKTADRRDGSSYQPDGNRRERMNISASGSVATKTSNSIGFPHGSAGRAESIPSPIMDVREGAKMRVSEVVEANVSIPVTNEPDSGELVESSTTEDTADLRKSVDGLFPTVYNHFLPNEKDREWAKSGVSETSNHAYEAKPGGMGSSSCEAEMPEESGDVLSPTILEQNTREGSESGTLEIVQDTQDAHEPEVEENCYGNLYSSSGMEPTADESAEDGQCPAEQPPTLPEKEGEESSISEFFDARESMPATNENDWSESIVASPVPAAEETGYGAVISIGEHLENPYSWRYDLQASI
ncbi:hypothetical protein E1B28_003768 [Marasmius oreades]|uniref:Uncharacterized protein n=1 Tax=Marasmius oreades TaxID=181124 RepID=A0A9P7UX79_9AGAR|nr:uncharacterized protein E1B28_003768 [Marasmius oreades]KAG7096324.1 hypothetical protein E1B28_003768 [Marasmius oreades]